MAGGYLEPPQNHKGSLHLMKEAAERLRRKAAQGVDGGVRTTGRTRGGPGGKVAG